MRRFARDLEKAIVKDVHRHEIDMDCPHCNRKIKVKVGKNICRYCRNEINVTLN